MKSKYMYLGTLGTRLILYGNLGEILSYLWLSFAIYGKWASEPETRHLEYVIERWTARKRAAKDQGGRFSKGKITGDQTILHVTDLYKLFLLLCKKNILKEIPKQWPLCLSRQPSRMLWLSRLQQVASAGWANVFNWYKEKLVLLGG